MSSPECSQITWRERESHGYWLQNSDSSRDKSEGQTIHKKTVTPRKFNQHQQLSTVNKPAACFLLSSILLPATGPSG